MGRSIFGWDYPPGCSSVPGDEPDPPCEVCGQALVNACPRGFAARIGAHYEVRTTAQAASEAVASKALGFNNAAEVREHNREVRVHNRAVNRANREAARPIVDQMLAGNFDPLFELMKRS